MNGTMTNKITGETESVDEFRYVGGELDTFAAALRWKRYWSGRILGYVPPEEFEQDAASGKVDSSGAAGMSFFRRQEIYRRDHKSPEHGEPNRSSSPAHRIDESPTGYSLAGCSPAEPDSASPAIDYPQGEGNALNRQSHETATVSSGNCLT